MMRTTSRVGGYSGPPAGLLASEGNSVELGVCFSRSVSIGVSEDSALPGVDFSLSRPWLRGVSGGTTLGSEGRTLEAMVLCFPETNWDRKIRCTVFTEGKESYEGLSSTQAA